MYWLIKELVERAITYLVDLSKGESHEEKLVNTLKTLILFITFIVMLNFWILGKYVNMNLQDKLIIESSAVKDTIDLLEINESLTSVLDKKTRENGLLIRNAILITVENAWLKSTLDKALENIKDKELKYDTLRSSCTAESPLIINSKDN